MLTVDGEVCSTFHDACIQRHLLADDHEDNKAMAEASHFQMLRQLCSMFATICIYPLIRYNCGPLIRLCQDTQP